MTVVCINEYDDDFPFIKVSLNDGTVIAQGRAFYQKLSYTVNVGVDDEIIKNIDSPLLSIDNKYFFNPLSDKFTITKIKGGEFIPFNPTSSELNIKHWDTVRTNLLNPDVYVDQDINECDIEIRGLVMALNGLPFIETTGSCSGHSKHRIYVDIRFRRMNELVGFLKLLEKHFADDFVLSSNPHIKQNSNETALMTLYSVEKGEKAYKSANKLTKYIEMISS